MKKSKLWIVLLLVVLFIPTYIGVFSYLRTAKEPVDVENATVVQISDLAGRVYEETSDSPIVKLIEKINANAIKLSTPPEMLSGAEYYKVTYIDGKRSTEYRYFFSLNTEAVYYFDADGISYLVSAEDAAEFLTTKYAQCLYAEAYLPVLQTGETPVVPSSYEWAFLAADGETVLPATMTATADGRIAYTGKNGLAFTFSREPESFDVTVKSEDGTLLYEGSYAEMAGAVDVKKYSTLQIDAVANWVGSGDHISSGSAKYSFTLNIEAQTEFLLSGDTVLPGGFVGVTAVNVKNPAAIGFTVSPALTHGGKAITPRFYADGKNAYALLPTTYETEPGTYTVTFSYEGISYDFTLTVEAKTFKKQSYDIAKTTVTATRTAETLATYEKVVAGIVSGDFGTKYFDGLFNMGIAEEGYNGTIMTGYGLTRNISATGESYRHDGVDFYAKNGTNVLAVNAGKVVYVGSTAYTGMLVVVDHGYGLLSWYGNLSEATAKVGDVVAAGDVIAKSGSTGFTKGNSLHVGLTVFDIPVCPYDLWETPLVFQ